MMKKDLQMDILMPSGVNQRPVDRAYETIRRNILNGAFAPGEPLREERLAELADASRTPVREALRRLASEGLVTISATRRSHVAEFKPFEVQAVYEIRVRLESYAAGLACERIDRDGLERLKEINSRIEALGPEVSNYSLTQFMELNVEFHLAIVRIAGSRQLEAALTTAITVPLVLLKHYVWDDTVRIELSHRQHREIIEALGSGNPHWASTCIASHIESSRPVSVIERHVDLLGGIGKSLTGSRGRQTPID